MSHNKKHLILYEAKPLGLWTKLFYTCLFPFRTTFRSGSSWLSQKFHQPNSDDTTLKHFTQVFQQVKRIKDCILMFWETCSTPWAHDRACHSKDRKILLITKKKSKWMQSRHSHLCQDKGKLPWWNKELTSYRGTDTLWIAFRISNLI